MLSRTEIAQGVFLATVALTFLVALWARIRSSTAHQDEALAGRSLNRWLVGLSAATTGNSGFVVTGAVGLGYTGGVHWVLLPLSWLLGDLLFWRLFPGKINEFARDLNATTVTQMLTKGLAGPSVRVLGVVVSVLLAVFLSTYASAQWMAGRKFLAGLWQINEMSALVIFGLTIVAYSSLGGFRGSVYTDTLQAVIRVAGTIVALGAVVWVAHSHSESFDANIEHAGADFLQAFPGESLIAATGFILGFALAAVGFGLGQPQIITRYMAGSSPEETKSARWIYIGFLQFTWISMTIFGVILRGVMPGLRDPEAGLSLFFQQNIPPVVTGLILADVFATIASTANGVLVAVAQTVDRDMLGGQEALGKGKGRLRMTAITLCLGLITIPLAFLLSGSVYATALDSISKIGAGIAGPMIIRLYRWRHTGFSLLAATLTGIAASFVWSSAGLSSVFNEAGVGILASLGVNFGLNRVFNPLPRHSKSQREGV